LLLDQPGETQRRLRGQFLRQLLIADGGEEAALLAVQQPLVGVASRMLFNIRCSSMPSNCRAACLTPACGSCAAGWRADRRQRPDRSPGD
jgi:hypothetical protein